MKSFYHCSLSFLQYIFNGVNYPYPLPHLVARLNTDCSKEVIANFSDIFKLTAFVVSAMTKNRTNVCSLCMGVCPGKSTSPF